ncbi:hypothetical protein F4677DRAFT_437262 [Hypoxylon crocopeplum]|nr:hypothetical protein F4677DRAFT_437262 [Hypoxylon crocopeplum]
MAQFNSALEASSYLHPDRNGPYAQHREHTVKKMLNSGCEYITLAEHPLSWADDQDPFRHVMAQAYPRITSRCFNRLLESFEEALKEEFTSFTEARGISVVTKTYATTIRRVAKYPDTMIAGVRITEVRADRFHVIYSVWSVLEEALVANLQSWIVFFDNQSARPVDILLKGGVFSDLHTNLSKRAEESKRAIQRCEKEKATMAEKQSPKL